MLLSLLTCTVLVFPAIKRLLSIVNATCWKIGEFSWFSAVLSIDIELVFDKCHFLEKYKSRKNMRKFESSRD